MVSFDSCTISIQPSLVPQNDGLKKINISLVTAALALRGVTGHVSGRRPERLRILVTQDAGGA